MSLFGIMSPDVLIRKNQRIEELEADIEILLEALKEAVAYEEKSRAVMASVNKEFGMDEPKQLQWVTNAIAAIKLTE
jgi:hypothetical protein